MRFDTGQTVSGYMRSRSVVLTTRLSPVRRPVVGPPLAAVDSLRSMHSLYDMKFLTLVLP